MLPLREIFKRRQRGDKLRHEAGRAIELRIAETGARVGRVQLRGFFATQFGEFVPECRKRMRQPGAAAMRSSAAQHRDLQGRDSRSEAAFKSAQAGQWMLEQSEQLNRRKPAESDLRGKACKAPGEGIGKRIPTGVVDRNIPATKRGIDAAR